MDGSEKGRGPLRIAGGNPPPAFEVEDGVLHQMAQFIEVFVVVALDEPVLFGRDYRIHSLSCRLLQNGISIVAPIGQKMVCGYAFDEVASLCAIRSGT